MPRVLRAAARRRLSTLLMVAAVASAAAVGSGLRTAHAAVTFDSALFSLINQDRAANGVAPLAWDSTLSGIAQGSPYSGCGFTVGGRAQDLIARNYFSHTICGTQNVFNVMQSRGIQFGYAGENIGWESGVTDPASAASMLNTMYMNSPEHRANILNPHYTRVGVGSWSTAPGQTWSGGGTAVQQALMSVEDFADGAVTPLVAASQPGAGRLVWRGFAPASPVRTATRAAAAAPTSSSSPAVPAPLLLRVATQVGGASTGTRALRTALPIRSF